MKLYDTDALISIIVPVFNGELYISNCIESLQKQNYHNIEIIIIDDGSTDNTKDICNLYLDDKRIVYKWIENHGPAYARNTGMSMASGDWIMFVDSDDYVDSTICKKLLNLAQEHNLDICFCNLVNIYEDGREDIFIPFNGKKIIFEGEKKEYLEYSLVSKISETGDSLIALTGPCCKLIKRDIAFLANFPENISLGEDTCFVIEMFTYANKIGYIDEALYFRNILNYSLSNCCKDEDIRLVEFTNWVEKYYEKNNRMRSAVNILNAHNMRKILFDYLAGIPFKKYTEAVSHVRVYSDRQIKKLSMKEILTINIEMKAKIILMLSAVRMYRIIWAIYCNR